MATLIPGYELSKQIGKQVEFDAATVDDLIRQGIARFGEPFRRPAPSPPSRSTATRSAR